MNLDQALNIFFVESRELLDAMETALLGIRQEADQTETLNAIFRAAHTIKGSAGLFGLDPLVAFTHVAESVLDEVREGRIGIDDALITLLLSCADHLRELVDAAEADAVNIDTGLIARGEPLLVQLRTYLAPATKPKHELAEIDVPLERIASQQGGSDAWHISLRFGPDVLRNGMDPLSFLRYLGTLGTVVGVVTLTDALPADDEMDPESCYLGFEIALHSRADKSAIESVFDFVLDDCQLRIVPPNSRIDDYLHILQSMPDDSTRLGEMLVRAGTVTAHELEAALQRQADVRTVAEPEAAPALLGDVLVAQGAAPATVVEAALDKQKRAREVKAQEGQSIRVDADKLDRLINLVGELIIASAGANLIARATRNVELQEANSTLSALVEEVRDSALQLRMVKIGGTFSRFQRVVHDVSRELGKDIQLVVSGEDTELDKTVVEKIGDPLTHLVRNAMDHGIDAPELRAQRGKPARGTVKLNAYHDSGSIVIEVSDDGGGLHRDKIMAKAVERGLVEPGKVLSDSEVYGLIFEPGFSTAEKVTNLSGRGVGMDVVKRNITALRGSVAIDSKPGLGTTVSVRLPLTLAIINGFQIGVGRSIFVVPLDVVDECIEFSAEPGHDYTDLRGEVLPFIRLRELFDIKGPTSARPNIVVVKHAGMKFGLAVDTLLGEAQTVIKPLSKMFGNVQGISGSSILGSGDVALILDVPALAQRATTPAHAGARGVAEPAA